MAVSGNPAKSEGLVKIQVGVKNGQVILKGQFVTFDANGFAQIGTTTENPNVTGRGIASEAKTGITADGTVKIGIYVKGFVYCVAGAAIKPNSRLQIISTAGQVTLATAGTAAGTEQNKHLDADYIGHEGEVSGNATDAASTDIICVRLR